MYLTKFSAKQLSEILSNDQIFEHFESVKDDEGSKELRKVAKILMSEFDFKPSDYEKVMFILKLANSCPK